MTTASDASRPPDRRVEPELRPGALPIDGPPPLAPGSRTGWAIVALGLLVFIGLVAAAYRYWDRPAASAPAPVDTAVPAAPPAPAVTASGPSRPLHPIEAPEAPEAGTAAAPDPAAALRAGLVGLLGERAVLTLLQTDGFAARVAATVDNLGRSHAAPRLWPVVPAAGRFTVQQADGATTAAPANAVRYEPFVALLAGADMRRAAVLYKRHYAQFQAAYRALGYPDGHFNDRLVEVIDAVLAAPAPATPPALRLTEVKGPMPGDRPWVRYEYDDPALQALPAGARILLRLSPAQAASVRARLGEFRDQVAASPRR